MKPISSFNFGILVTPVRNDRGLHLGWLLRPLIELLSHEVSRNTCANSSTVISLSTILAAKRILPGYVEFVVSSARIVALRHLPFLKS